MDKYIYDCMAETIEVAASNTIAPYGAIIVYDNKDILFTLINEGNVFWRPGLHSFRNKRINSQSDFATIDFESTMWAARSISSFCTINM